VQIIATIAGTLRFHPGNMEAARGARGSGSFDLVTYDHGKRLVKGGPIGCGRGRALPPGRTVPPEVHVPALAADAQVRARRVPASKVSERMARQHCYESNMRMLLTLQGA
jgi:hypothetical protein